MVGGHDWDQRELDQAVFGDDYQLKEIAQRIETLKSGYRLGISATIPAMF